MWLEFRMQVIRAVKGIQQAPHPRWPMAANEQKLLLTCENSIATTTRRLRGGQRGEEKQQLAECLIKPAFNSGNQMNFYKLHERSIKADVRSRCRVLSTQSPGTVRTYNYEDFMLIHNISTIKVTFNSLIHAEHWNTRREAEYYSNWCVNRVFNLFITQSVNESSLI